MWRSNLLSIAMFAIICSQGLLAGSPLAVDATSVVQSVLESNHAELTQGRPKTLTQNLDSEIAQAKQELAELKSKSEALTQQIQTMEETRSKILEIENLLAQLPESSLKEIEQWIHRQLTLDQHSPKNKLTPSQRLEREQIMPLEVELGVLIDTFGEQHPRVLTIRKRLEFSSVNSQSSWSKRSSQLPKPTKCAPHHHGLRH